MTAIPLGSHSPGSPEWDDVRRFRLGGSEIAAVLGLSPWQSPLSLYLHKKGLIAAQLDNPAMDWGRRIEPIVRERFIEDHPGQWVSNPGMFAHPDRRWQSANPDALMGFLQHETGDLLEVKTSPHGDDWGETGTDEVPVYYRCQLLWYIDVLGVDGGWMATLIRGADYREYRLERDSDAEADIEIMREAGERFVTDLINDRMPDIDRHAATYRAIRELHPDIQPGQVEIDPGLAGDYLAAYLAEKEAKADKDYYGTQILAELGNLKDAVVREDDGSTNRFAYRTHRSKDGQPGVPFLQADQKRMKQLTHVRTIQEALEA